MSLRKKMIVAAALIFSPLLGAGLAAMVVTGSSAVHACVSLSHTGENTGPIARVR